MSLLNTITILKQIFKKLVFSKNKMKTIIDYLKYDNSYWDKSRKKALKTRLAIYALVPLICFNLHTIFQRKYPWQNAKDLSIKVVQGTKELTQDFPMGAIAHYNLWKANNHSLSQDELKHCLESQITNSTINSLINKDEKVNYSEVGGLVVLKNDEKGKYLDFIELKSENQKVADKIIAHRENKEYLKKLFHLERYIFEPILSKKLYENVSERIQKNEMEHYFLEKIIPLFLYFSDSQYLKNVKDIKKQFYPGEHQGKILGKFHIHNRGRPPSNKDLESSKYLREFVIVTEGKGYDIYQLNHGKTISLIEMAFEKINYNKS